MAAGVVGQEAGVSVRRGRATSLRHAEPEFRRALRHADQQPLTFMRFRLLFAAIALVAALSPRAAPAQVGSTTDIITGIVTGPDGRPISGARVEVTSVETETKRSKTTNDKG